jgi:hypothetical protein
MIGLRLVDPSIRTLVGLAPAQTEQQLGLPFRRGGRDGETSL